MRKRILSGMKRLFFVQLYLSDVLSFAVACIAATLLLGVDMTLQFNQRFFIFTLLILIFSYTSFGLYKDKRNLFDDSDFMNLLYSGLTTGVFLLLFILMFDPSDVLLMLALGTALIVNLILSTIGRLALNQVVCFFRKKGYDTRNTIFFGQADEHLISKLNDKIMGYRIIKITSNFEELKKSISKAQVVFLKMESIDDHMLKFMMDHDEINWKIVSSLLNLVIDPVSLDEFKDYPIINISNKDSTQSYSFLKRLFDITVSGISIIVLSPLLLAIAILIKIIMPGPVFFRQERLGKNLKPFRVFKFRTMIVNADQIKSHLMKKNEVKGLFKMKDDPRITKLGKILRRTCLDELPQLFNIFTGDMSIVGPRPHLQSELENFSGWRMTRFKVKPGLTGLWQVNGRHELNFDKAVLYDIYYVKHMSFLLDLNIILKTIPAIIMNRGRF